MNVFLLSPGRTGTVTLSRALARVEGYTSGHETRVDRLGADRIDYPENHIECDNRLSWFLPRLTRRYAENGLLVIVRRDVDAIARSYNRRWHQINIMKAYSQGVLLRDLTENSVDVCKDYVRNVYEHVEYFATAWSQVISLDIDRPEQGMRQLLAKLGRSDDFERVLDYLTAHRLNPDEPVVGRKLKTLLFNVRNLVIDLIRN